ncbi:hypothetical protein FIV42_25585 [Persicimonas caeni]|uniref:Uncharacterized protein n=1 Tax=Persicimonas caeni TaxID=2292766 RepID=A0A4Y6Q0M5_PERCE|nr:hypothetical protein FIV42_25585 [Persicimonas caeni]QED35210.1 hypothetical protein FRD00_25580 [Persicimonas caeni]
MNRKGSKGGPELIRSFAPSLLYSFAPSPLCSFTPSLLRPSPFAIRPFCKTMKLLQTLSS